MLGVRVENLIPAVNRQMPLLSEGCGTEGRFDDAVQKVLKQTDLCKMSILISVL